MPTRTYTAAHLADSAVALATLATSEARSLTPYGAILHDAHRRLGARLLLAAAARVLPAGERNDIERPIDAIHDYLLLTVPIGAEERAEDNIRLRRIFRDLCGLAVVIANDLDKAAANGSPDDDWSDVRGWLKTFAEPEGQTVYEDDLDRYQREEMVA